MTNQDKELIKWELENYVSTFRSQHQACNTITGCSEANIIAMLKGHWNSISDEMWRNVASQINDRHITGPVVETKNFKSLVTYFSLAKDNGVTLAITAGAGYGKTFTAKVYSKQKKAGNVYYLQCASYWNRKTFLSRLLTEMGKNPNGLTIGEMMEVAVKELRRQNKPLIILDEIDKLYDAVLQFFITLYNELNGLCGFVWLSTDNIEKRINKGVASNKNGYQELFSRVGQKFIALRPASTIDIQKLCAAKSITNPEDIAKIINECNGDLRRVDRNFLKHKIRAARNAA